MRKIVNGIFIIASLMLLFPGCYDDNEYDLYPFSGQQCDSSNVTYSQTIAPIMTANCNVCHSTALASGKVVTDNYTGLSVVAKNGKLRGGVNWESGFKPMPNGGNKLSPCDVGKINIWINQGSPDN